MAQESFLDGPMPDIVAQWRHYFERLDPGDGHCVLDVGCDTGDALRFLARERPDIDRLCGVEFNDARCRRAISRWRASGSDARLALQRADARALPYADGMFDRAICAEALEFIDPPERALREIKRVLTPNGRALVVHTDWETQVFATRDPARSRRMVRAFAGDGPGGDIGRRLPALCRRAGFAHVSTEGYALVNDQWHKDHYAPSVVNLMTRWLARDRAVPPEELQAWREDIDGALADGSFCYAVVRFICLCQP